MTKNLGVKSSFNFTGLLLQENTQLTADFDDFILNNTMKAKQNKLTISTAGYFNTLALGSNFNILVDPFNYLTYVSVIDFDYVDLGRLVIKGTALGIYSEVYGVPLIDLVSNTFEGEINPAGYLQSQSLYSSSLLGTD